MELFPFSYAYAYVYAYHGNLGSHVFSLFFLCLCLCLCLRLCQSVNQPLAMARDEYSLSAQIDSLVPLQSQKRYDLGI